jgi:hypothetical protein
VFSKDKIRAGHIRPLGSNFYFVTNIHHHHLPKQTLTKQKLSHPRNKMKENQTKKKTE